MGVGTPALSFTGLFILQALAQGYKFGFDIMEVTGLPSGTIYPALRRLEALELVTSDWEQDTTARKEGRPAAALLRAHARGAGVSSRQLRRGFLPSTA